MARSAAATTVILWLKVVVSLLIMLLLGVASWPWLRPACLILLGGIALVGLALRIRPYAASLGVATRGHPRLHAAWAWVLDFRSVVRSYWSRAPWVRPRLSPRATFCALR